VGIRWGFGGSGRSYAWLKLYQFEPEPALRGRFKISGAPFYAGQISKKLSGLLEFRLTGTKKEHQ